MSLDPHATYYDAGGIETIDVIKAKLTPEQFIGYCLGNVIKYSGRLNHKTPKDRLRDAQKTAMYAQLLQAALTTTE